MKVFEALMHRPILCSVAIAYIVFCVVYIWRMKKKFRAFAKIRDSKFQCIDPDPKKFNSILVFMGMLILLIPRLVGCLVFSLLYMIMAYSFSAFSHTTLKNKIQKKISSILTRIILFFGGIIKINIRQFNNIDWQKYPKIRQSNVKLAPVVISNHIGYIDIVFAMHMFYSSFISSNHVLKIPIVRVAAKSTHCLFLDRKSKTDKDAIMLQIKERVDKISDDTNQILYSPLAIFPEGICHNQKYVTVFKRGAFSPLKPIQPIFISLRSCRWQSSYYFFDLIEDIIAILSNPYEILDGVLLPKIEPITTDPTEYSNEVRKLYIDSFNLIPAELDIFERDKYIQNFRKVYQNL
jgi:1-acyl-sn-glycerol-3-phosphate acyltransferase